MMQLFDDIQSYAASIRDTASTVRDIRTDWVETQQIFKGDSGGSVTVQQAAIPARVAQAQGNVGASTQWNADAIAKAITGGAGGGGALLVIGAVVLFFVMKGK